MEFISIFGIVLTFSIIILSIASAKISEINSDVTTNEMILTGEKIRDEVSNAIKSENGYSKPFKIKPTVGNYNIELVNDEVSIRFGDKEYLQILPEDVKGTLSNRVEDYCVKKKHESIYIIPSETKVFLLDNINGISEISNFLNIEGENIIPDFVLSKNLDSDSQDELLIFKAQNIYSYNGVLSRAFNIEDSYGRIFVPDFGFNLNTDSDMEEETVFFQGFNYYIYDNELLTGPFQLFDRANNLVAPEIGVPFNIDSDADMEIVFFADNKWYYFDSLVLNEVTEIRDTEGNQLIPDIIFSIDFDRDSLYELIIFQRERFYVYDNGILSEPNSIFDENEHLIVPDFVVDYNADSDSEKEALVIQHC